MANRNVSGQHQNEASADSSSQSSKPDPSSGALERIGIRELRNQVAALVRRAADGERIIVTVDGQPMAQLGPLTPVGGATLDDLFASGLARAPRRGDHPAAPEPIEAPVDTGFRSSIDAMRGST